MDNNNNFNYGNYPGKSKSTAAMVCGIVGLVFAWMGWGALVAIGASIAGIILSSQAKKELPAGAPTGMATAGFVTSIIALAISSIVFVACTLCLGAFALFTF